MSDSRQLAKKRLMFIQKEDYNFLTYNLLLLLKILGANSRESRFQDYKKIAYLIHFISTDYKFTEFDRKELAIIYSRSHLKKQLLSHLVLILKNKKFIEVELNYVRNSLDIWVVEENIPENFFSKDLFQNEINNIKNLKSEIPRLKILTLKSVVEKVFTNNKVITWEV